MNFNKVTLESVSGSITVGIKVSEGGEERRSKVEIPAESISSCITERAKIGGWQDAHRHNGLYETTVVARGWCALATLDREGNIKLKRFAQNSVITVPPGTAYGLYLPVNAIIVTTRHGKNATINDRFSEPKLAALCEATGEEELQALPFEK